MKKSILHSFLASCTLLSTLVATGQMPVINSFSPLSGPAGTAVTISGSGFDGVTASNNVVHFGAVTANVTGASPTSLTVTVPGGAGYSSINVFNTVSKLNGNSALPFTTTFAGCIPLSSGSLTAKVDFGAGTVTRSVVFADLDGDGKADMIATNTGTNNVSAFRNLSTTGGAASFSAKADFATDVAASGIAAGDMNGDGKLDLVVSNYNTASISVLINTTTGANFSFSPKVDFATTTNPLGIAIADFDGDGKSDIAVANFFAATASISLFRNTTTTGTPTFASQTLTTGVSAPRELAAGDMDKDGKPDLVVSDEGGSKILAYLNTSVSGTISFGAPVTSATGVNPRGISLGDLNGDSKLDIAVVNSGSASISVFTNTSPGVGTIAFTAKTDYTTGASPREIALGDIDGDGRPEMAASANTGAVLSVLRNTSTGGTISFAGKVDFTAGVTSLGVGITDINNDGKLDIAVTSSSTGAVGVFINASPTSPLATIATVNATTSTVCDNSTWKTLYGGVGNGNAVIASVKDNGNNLGALSGTVYIDAMPGTVGTSRYLSRHFLIAPTTQPVSPVQVRLYFTNAELLVLQAVDPSISSLGNLSVTKYSGPGEDGVYNTAGGTAVLIPSSDITTGTDYGNPYLEFTISSFSEFWIHGGLTVLPVELISFTADKEPEGILLKWTTASESNSDRFIVERSADGRNYTAIGSVSAAGSSASSRTYSFTDLNPLKGLSYYRLQQLDIDGRGELSKVLRVNSDVTSNITVNLAYQSARQVRATINGKVDKGAFIIYDGNGREIKSYQISTANAGSVLTIDLSAYGAGIYLYRVVTSKGNTVNNGKIILK